MELTDRGSGYESIQRYIQIDQETVAACFRRVIYRGRASLYKRYAFFILDNDFDRGGACHMVFRPRSSAVDEK